MTAWAEIGRTLAGLALGLVAIVVLDLAVDLLRRRRK